MNPVFMDVIDLLIMKLVKKEFLINVGDFSSSKEWKKIDQDIENAIKKVTWPKNSKKITINPERKGNGVAPIKRSFCSELKNIGWELETALPIANRIRPRSIRCNT